MKHLYAVHIKENSVPMAIFLREDWANSFMRKMYKRNPSAPLEVIYRDKMDEWETKTTEGRRNEDVRRVEPRKIA